ncbi:MAG: cadmium-translocating P-type ATPase [Bacilli bacterium]|nr:cadmium-translocating P-type ATPase [Bacilli bacterium]
MSKIVNSVYIIENVDCPNCAAKAASHLEKDPRVEEATIDFATGKLYLRSEEMSIEEIQRIIQEVEDEFIVKPIGDGHHHCEGECHCGEEHHHEHEHHHDGKVVDQIFIVENMDCPNCANEVADHIEHDPRVEEATIDFATGKLYIKGAKLSLEEVQSLVSEVEDEFVVKPYENKRVENKLLNAEFFIKAGRIIASIILVLIGRFAFGATWVGDTTFYVYLALCLASWLICSYDILWKCAKNIAKLQGFMDETFLMTIASLGAFLLPLLTHDAEPWFDAALVVILFQVGEIFEDFASKKSHQSIINAIESKELVAHLVTDDGVFDIDPSLLKVGNTILVNVGEGFPIDGEIIEGEGNVDVSSLTGEFEPEFKTVGDEVLSSTILKSGTLKIKVTSDYENRTSAKIVKLVEESARTKSKAEKFITRFARVYTPIVLVLALLISVVPPLFVGISNGPTWASWVEVGLSFLVVSCPCAIIISVPLNFFAGVGLASKKGIIIKGSSYFDKLAKIKTLAMDKTGTLTYGNFQVTEWHVVKGTQEEFISYLQAAESRSNHPIAKAIVGNSASLANEQNNYEEIAGKGIKTEWNGHTILAGNLSLLEDNGISAENPSTAGTLVYLAVDNEYYGYAVLNDVVRKESKPLIDRLHKLGIKTCLLTGDKKERAEDIGNSLGIDEIHSELLPSQKVEVIKSKLDENNGMVAYVGDGINDAPSLALADVGCAMGGVGSDTAIEAADVVFMNDDPSRFVTAVKLAKICKRRAVGLIAFALAVKVGIMIASIICSAIGAIFPLWIAVLGDTGLTVLCVFLTLTINFERID